MNAQTEWTRAQIWTQRGNSESERAKANNQFGKSKQTWSNTGEKYKIVHECVRFFITFELNSFGRSFNRKWENRPFIFLHLFNILCIPPTHTNKFLCRQTHEHTHTHTFNLFRLFDRFLYVRFAIVSNEVLRPVCFLPVFLSFSPFVSSLFFLSFSLLIWPC